jgi:hypothetical protein
VKASGDAATGWAFTHAVAVILTRGTRPKAIDALHTYRNLIFKTSTRGKLVGKERCYNAKLFMVGICMKTKGSEESDRRRVRSSVSADTMIVPALSAGRGAE